MITTEQTQVNTQELIKKINSGCYLSKFDRDNIVKDMLELQETVYNQQQENGRLKEHYIEYRKYCADYTNVQCNEALAYQKRIRDLEKEVNELKGKTNAST